MRILRPIVISLLSFKIYGFNEAKRRKVILRQNSLCGKCNRPFSKMVPHEIHHLNHNNKDNKQSNLIALCANCHAAHHRFGVSISPLLLYNENNISNRVYYDKD